MDKLTFMNNYVGSMNKFHCSSLSDSHLPKSNNDLRPIQTDRGRDSDDGLKA